MITLNDKIVTVDSFPDGTMLMKEAVCKNEASIKWTYENDREFLALIYLTKHLQTHGVNHIDLYMPYIPNARQDRVKNKEDVFTLKYFAEILNSLNFTSVTVLDPHSSVSEALIDNLVVESPAKYIAKCIGKIPTCMCKDVITLEESLSLMMFYPDEGSMKRYSSIVVDIPYAFGVKKRDWKTGKINGLDVISNGNDITYKDILIVDDICSYGGTFLHSARKLKKLGAHDIYLYVSHCENSILDGELINSGLIKKIYTTDSIFTKKHELIEVLK